MDEDQCVLPIGREQPLGIKGTTPSQIPLHPCILYIAIVKDKIHEKIKFMGMDPWENNKQYWHNMKFDHSKHDIENLKVLGKMIGMSDEQV